MSDIITREFKIMWSTILDPETIQIMLAHDRITECLENNRLPVKLYDGDKYEMFVNLSEPHGWINKIEFTEDKGCIATVSFIDRYKHVYELFTNPVIHPIILGDPKNQDKSFIAYFKMFDEYQLNKKMIYDGVHYPDEFIDDGSAIKHWRQYPSHPTEVKELVVPKFVIYQGQKFPLIVHGKFNPILEKLFVKEIDYHITFGHNAEISGSGCMVYGAGGNLDYICIGVTDRELGRSVDMRFNLHTIEYNTKGFEIHVKEPQR